MNAVISSNKNAPDKTEGLASSMGVYKNPMPSTYPMLLLFTYKTTLMNSINIQKVTEN